MPISTDIANALTKAGLIFQEDIPLSKKAWWRVGGRADVWISVSTVLELQSLLRIADSSGCPLFVIGNGSNLLVADAGIRGIVVQLGGALAGCERVAEDEIILGAGLKLMVLQNRAFKEGWTGLECFAGIPGTVGGAVRMNAGSQLGEVVNNLNWIEVVTITGLVKRIPAADLGMSYRTSNLPKGAVVTAAGMRLTDEPADQHQLRVRSFLERRKVTQPLDLPSCGSTFRNPQGDHAGRLIEAAGLKGFQVGGAQVSTKHANFVVNLGGATAADIRSVIEAIQTEVLERFQVQLLREVHFVGDWSDWSVSE
jgi:UDP-N-acetylmuramate dehydrogenase